MRRREFATLLGFSIVAMRSARAQTRPRVPRIAVLDWVSEDAGRIGRFRQDLRELGYVDGENILVAYHFAEGRAERAEALAAEIVRGGADVIVAFTTPAARAVQQATSTIPIVASSADPVGTGLVTNLARPGGNITGFSNMMPDLESKRMELLRDLMPNARRLAFLGSARDPATRNFVRETQAAAARIGASVEPYLIDNADGIDGALAAMVHDKIEAVIVQPLFGLDTRAATRMAELAARHRVPAIGAYLSFPRAGGLLSFGPDQEQAFRAVWLYVDRILKGAKPGDLPVAQPTRFVIGINLKTAAALGLAIPQVLLLRADEVIE